MIKRIIHTSLLVGLASSFVYGANSVHFNAVAGDQETKYEKEFLPSLEDATGFVLADPHEKIDDAYASKYGDPKSPEYDKGYKNTLDNLGFFPVSNDKALHPLLLTHPQLAAFQPFNLLIYKTKAEDVSYIGHIAPEAMLDIVGVGDAQTRKAYTSMFGPLDSYVTKSFGGKVEDKQHTTLLPKQPMMHFEISVDKSQDLLDWVEGFQENFEAAFEDKEYVIAGFKNFKEVYADLEMPFDKYEQFFVYGLCHFKFSYEIFNKGRPDAGVFAPCSMYFYIEKGSNKMIVGMPKVANWGAVMDIKDPKKLKAMQDIDNEIVAVMKSLGAKEI